MASTLLYLLFVFSCCCFASAQTSGDTNVTEITDDDGVTTVATGVGQWTQTEGAAADWYMLTTSTSGEYMYAIADKVIWISNDFGNEWFQSNAPPLSYKELATNSSGQLVYALYPSIDEESASIYISTDFGATWTPSYSLTPQGYYQSLTCSSSGEVIYVVGFSTDIYVSMDYGDTWRSPESTNVQDEGFFQVVTDSSGKNATTVSGSGGGVFSTNDYGVSWFRQNFNTPSNQFTGVQMSSDGKVVMVVDIFVLGGIYLSTNYGFDMRQLPNAPNITVSTITASDDMQFVMTLNYQNDMSTYFTGDGGESWNITEYSTHPNDGNEDESFFTIAAAGTGQLFVAGDYGGGLYLYQPACPTGYQHVGFDAEVDPNGTNLCFTCDAGYYAQYTADGQDVVCLACSVGTYSSASSVYGSDSCTECPSLYSTVDDACDDKSSCHVFEVNLAQMFQWIIYSAGFVWFLMVIYYATRPSRLMSGEKNILPAVFLVLVFPFLDLCTDFAYLMISPFYHVSIFVLCVICFMHPAVLFMIRLCKLRALPTSLCFIWWLSYDMSAGGEDTDHININETRQSEKSEGEKETARGDFMPFPTITYPRDASTVVTSRFALVFAFEVHDNLFTLTFEVLVWCVAVVLQIFTLFALPAFLLLWLVVGMILQLTQTITLSSMWNGWYLLWTGTDKFSDTGTGGVDTEDLNYGILNHFLLEAVPGLALQAVNNTLMDTWTTDALAITSIGMSIVMCVNVLYRYFYHSKLHAEPVGMKNIPVDRSIRVKIMLLSVDWSVLDARLPPYTKTIKGAPRLSEFRYSVDEGGGSAALDLEESLLSDGEGGADDKILSYGHDNSSNSNSNSMHSQQGYGHTVVNSTAPSDISSVSSGGVGSGVSGWTGDKSDTADRLLFMFSTAAGGEEEQGIDSGDKDDDNVVQGSTSPGETPLTRMLVGAGVPSEMRGDGSLEHLDADIVIELFTENQSITVFIEEMSKFEVPRIISSKLFMHLKSLVKSM